MKPADKPVSTGFDPARLIENHQVGVWRYLRALGCDPALADDLTQETFLHVLRQPFEDYSTAATATYLRRSALNIYITLQRRNGRVVAVEDVEKFDQAWTAWAGSDNGDNVLDALRDCLQQLTERARTALEMRFRDDRSRDEIATALEITEHGAKNLMQRAKQQLRACIDEKLK
jgi:RNA polymerase sigma-70 factor (ECF subfamily)